MRSSQTSPAPVFSLPPHPTERRPSQQLTSTRTEEARAARESLSQVKTENEDLIAKVKQLEKELRELGGRDEPRGRVSQPRDMPPPEAPASAAL